MKKQTYTVADIAAVTGRSVRSVYQDIREELLTPNKSVKLPSGVMYLFTRTEVAGYEQYLLNAGLLRGRPRLTLAKKNLSGRRAMMQQSVRRIGLEATARAFGIKVDSLRRNLQNWEKKNGKEQQG